MKLGRLLLRATLGGFFIGHGTQKLLGWFGGKGLAATAAAYERDGIRPGKVQALAAGSAEALGGAGLALGYRTQLASAGIIATMVTAIYRVTCKRGPWTQNSGYEYNVVAIAAAAMLAETGPGLMSLDALRGKERRGIFWGLFSLVLGGAGAAGAYLFAESRAGAGAYPDEHAPADDVTAGATGAGVTEPGTTEPGTTESGAAESGGVEPGAAESAAAEPSAAGAGPEEAGAGATRRASGRRSAGRASANGLETDGEVVEPDERVEAEGDAVIADTDE